MSMRADTGTRMQNTRRPQITGAKKSQRADKLFNEEKETSGSNCGRFVKNTHSQQKKSHFTGSDDSISSVTAHFSTSLQSPQTDSGYKELLSSLVLWLFKPSFSL